MQTGVVDILGCRFPDVSKRASNSKANQLSQYRKANLAQERILNCYQTLSVIEVRVEQQAERRSRSDQVQKGNPQTGVR